MAETVLYSQRPLLSRSRESDLCTGHDRWHRRAYRLRKWHIICIITFMSSHVILFVWVAKWLCSVLALRSLYALPTCTCPFVHIFEPETPCFMRIRVEEDVCIVFVASMLPYLLVSLVKLLHVAKSFRVSCAVTRGMNPIYIVHVCSIYGKCMIHASTTRMRSIIASQTLVY